MLPQGLHRDHDRLSGFLRSISLRIQLLATLESALQLAIGVLLVLLGSIFALEWGREFPYLAFSYCLAALFFVAAILIRGLLRAARRPSITRVARGLENKFPRLRDDVINSLLLFPEMRSAREGQISEGLVRAQVRKTAEQVSGIRPAEVVNFRAALRHLRVLAPLLVAFLGVLAFDPQFLNRSLAFFTHPAGSLPVRETALFVQPEGGVVLRGKPVVIQARTEGHPAERLDLSVWPEGRELMRLKMEPEGKSRFSYRIESAQSSFRYRVSHSRGASPVYDFRVVDPPDIGKVKITITPPEYTGLPRETREGGQIEALKGTAANLEAETTREVKEARLVLDGGNQLPLEVEADRLKGSMMIFQPDTYSINVRDELGFENPNPVRYQIRVIPDKYPEGEIISPARDMEVSGQEIIPISYRAGDDFGITSVRINCQVGGKDRLINLKRGAGGRSLGPETFRWDLAALGLTPGDRVSYRLEVEDNDTVSGPKLGYSRSFNFFVRDERAQAAREGEEAQRIADALLDMLGDHLESPRNKEDLTRRMEELLSKVEKDLERMPNRPERFGLEALRRNMDSLKERMPQAPPETVTQELERMALLAEDLAKRARMNELEALAREVRNRQRRLLDSLNDLKGPLTDKDKQALMKELDKLEELMRQVMEALSKMAGALPDEFVNSPEMQGLDFQDLFSDLKDIREKLQAGDLSAALEAAQRLLQNLSEMMAALGRAGSRANMQSMGRMQGEMARQSGELDRILAEQKEILKETEKIDGEVKKRAEEDALRRLRDSLPRLEEILEQLRKNSNPEQKEAVEELARSLRREKLDQSSRIAGELEKDFAGNPGAQKPLEDFRKRLDDLLAEPKGLLSKNQKEKFPDLSARQEGLKERTRALQEKLEALSQLFPQMDPEILLAPRGAGGSMGEATGKLKEEDAPGAVPPEEDVIRRLSKSQQGMQQMAQQMAGQMQAAQWGYWGYDPRPGWYYGPWVPMPTLPQPELNRERERGYTGIDREEFKPPGKDDYRVPKIFREKVMEGLKEDVPPEYKRKVEKYFKGLTE